MTVTVLLSGRTATPAEFHVGEDRNTPSWDSQMRSPRAVERRQ